MDEHEVMAPVEEAPAVMPVEGTEEAIPEAAPDVAPDAPEVAPEVAA